MKIFTVLAAAGALLATAETAVRAQSYPADPGYDQGPSYGQGGAYGTPPGMGYGLPDAAEDPLPPGYHYGPDPVYGGGSGQEDADVYGGPGGYPAYGGPGPYPAYGAPRPYPDHRRRPEHRHEIYGDTGQGDAGFDTGPRHPHQAHGDEHGRRLADPQRPHRRPPPGGEDMSGN